MIGEQTAPYQRKQTTALADAVREIRPQPGPQTAFLSTSADLAIMGGAAGGSKTFSLLLECTRHLDNPGFGAVVFRRTYPEVTTPGGLWPESFKVYPYLKGEPNETKLLWKFPSGATVRFAHMQHEKNVLSWLGSQVCLIGFDQLEGFEESQFWYMLSRNRSMCGVRPYIRASANPRPGWLADLLAWWIDPVTGYPIQERSGALRWFVRREDQMEWADSWEELHQRMPDTVAPPDSEPDGINEKRLRPKSLTFVPAKLTDNVKLMEADPEYLANLQTLPRVERERLEKGNWLIGDAAGEFPQEYFQNIFFEGGWERVPDLQMRCMALDPSKGKEDGLGDFSAWIMLGVDRDLKLWVDCDADNKRQVEPMEGQPHLRSMVLDGIELYKKFKPHGVIIEVNGFQHLVAQSFVRISRQMGLNIPTWCMESTLNKQTRIRTLTPYLSGRRLRVMNTPGGRLLVQQLRDFPDKTAKDDCPDALKACEQFADHLLSGKAEGDGITPMK